MADADFKLPGVSLEELEKIIEAFSQRSGPASNEEIAKLAGSATSTISRSNGFLVGVGLVQGGNKKEATELGRKLGLALHHGQDTDARKYWNQVVTGNEFLSGQVTAVRVQKAVPKDDLPGKILYNSGNSKNKYTETGSRTVTDILVKAGLLSDDDGTYTVPKGAPKTVEKEEQSGAADEQHHEAAKPPILKGEKRSEQAEIAGMQLAVNLQIQVQEFQDTSKYEDLFRALRKYLLSPPDDPDLP